MSVEFHPDLIGIAQGNGPVHLLTPDAAATLCGRIQFGTYRRIGWPAERDCKYCQAVARKLQQVRRGLTADDLDQLDAALADMERVRARIADLLHDSMWPPAGTIERKRYSLWLRAAQSAGLTYEHVAKVTGRTRERIRQIASEVAS